jgi:CBS domain-containing protein
MQIKDIMTRGLEVISADSTVQEAAEKMKNFDIGMLPVMDGDELVGVITDRDIVVRSIAMGQDADATQVHDVMTSSVIHCLEDQTVDEAARIMEEHQIRRLVVFDQNRQPVGVVSMGDLAVHVDNLSMCGEALRLVSEPAHIIR